MRKIKKRLALALVLCLLCSILVGCGEGKEETPQEDFVLRIGVSQALETLDPAMSTDAEVQSLLATLFESLLRLRDDGTGNATVVSGIAKEYREEANFDGTVTYTFTLRSSARWSDGKRVKASDFVYAWRRLADPAIASPNASLLSMVAGWEEVQSTGDTTKLGVSSKGDGTFIVTLSAPCAYFLQSVCTTPVTAPLRRDYVESTAGWAESASILTNGPYSINTWIRGQSLQTKRNAEYYEGKLVIPDVLRFVFGTVQENYEKLQGGELDFVAKLPIIAQELTAEEVLSVPQATTVCVLYNHLTDTFSNPSIRKAFDLAIDRATLSDTLGVTAEPATGLVPTGISNAPESEGDYRTVGGTLCASDVEEYAARREEAATSLTATGHYQGAGIPKLRFVFEETQSNIRTANELLSTWESVLGVEVELFPMTQEEFSTAIAAGEFDIALYTASARYDDAMRFLQPLCSVPDGNVLGYQNGTYDLLVGVAEGTDDLAARAAFLHDAEAMLLEDYAISPLYFLSNVPLLREGLTGAYYDSFGHSYFTAVSEQSET